ncbi:MAG: energy transducer TonB [Paludibacteraceae bacterium]|jgi:protein TonB|nr:energy transducer TonB [Paludibacteraceae bacterium]MBP8627459.1 energy transducer TonB [Paludibacteraceae bacterium]MBP9647837.1 energy transducer TonB [Paludibacteraceae bacterium]MBP9970304.1 energy transducer TonB [Paludibacteraceae bacterium]
MEIKKTPKANLENKKTMAILIGLVLALGIMFIAFEWSKNEIKVYDDAIQGEFVEDEEMIEVTFRDETPPPPPPPIQETVLSDIIDIRDDKEDIQTKNFDSEDDKNKKVVIQAPIAAPVEDPEENRIHVVVERMPEFPGGEAAMNQFINRTIRYPVIAQENGIQGRVVVQFVVNTDGKIVDVEVVRGVEESLDKEAIRVVKAMPPWNPGRQGGKNVRVKYTLPIRFRIG